MINERVIDDKKMIDRTFDDLFYCLVMQLKTIRFASFIFLYASSVITDK